MKKRILIALVVVLALAATASLVWAGGGGGKAHAKGAEFYPFHLSGDVQLAPPYGTIDIPGSGGKVIVNQPEGEVSVVLTGVVNGLNPYTAYTVYLRNLNNPGAAGWVLGEASGGPWTSMLTFVTDETGHGDFHINIRADEMPVGVYNLSVWINDGLTLLISDNFAVTIE